MYVVIGIILGLVLFAWWSRREGLENPGDAAQRQQGNIMYYQNLLAELSLTPKKVDDYTTSVTRIETDTLELETAVAKFANADNVEKTMGYGT